MILDLYLGQKSKAAALVFLAFGFWLLAFGDYLSTNDKMTKREKLYISFEK
jgi:hypothetical protein